MLFEGRVQGVWGAETPLFLPILNMLELKPGGLSVLMAVRGNFQV